MRYTIRPGSSTFEGGMFVIAGDARGALTVVQKMIASGLTEVQIIDEAGNEYDRVELERVTREAEEGA